MKALTNLSPAEKTSRGIVHTPSEIAQQPTMWRTMGQRILEQRDDLARWLKDAPQPFVLTGAGTSEYAARCVVPSLRHAGINGTAVATTEIVIDPVTSLPSEPCTLISFARS